jgi:sigma-B regulation protein RsbQ
MTADVLARNHVRITGDPQARRTLVFANGFGCDQSVWRWVAPAFADEHRVVTFDYVGSGKSDLGAWSPVRYGSLEGYASDVLEVGRALDLRDAIFVGHSVSSMIGVLASLRDPGMFSDLVLVGPSPRYVNDGAYVGGFERRDIDDLLGLMDRNFVGWASALAPVIMGNADRPELASDLHASFCAADPVAARRFAEVAFLSDNRADLPRVTARTLVLQCSEDAIAPRTVGEHCHRHIAHSSFVQLQATGHCPHLSAPDEVVTIIRRWLAVSAVPLASAS